MAASLGISILIIYILGGLIAFCLLVLITPWIIKIGVQWGISKSIDDIKVAVRQGILSAEEIKKEREEKAKKTP